MNSNDIDPWLVFPRYCKHGKVIDDYCEDCEKEEAVEAERAQKGKSDG